MTFKVVTTKQDGIDGFSAKEYNQFIKDNAAAGVPDIFTTKGDLAVATAADTAARLAVGTNGDLLKAHSGTTPGMAWNAFFGSMAKTSGTVIATGTETTLGYTTEVYDTNNFQTVGASYSATIPAGCGGYYLIGCSIEVDGTASMDVNEYLRIDIMINTNIKSSGITHFQGGNSAKLVWLWDMLRLAALDVVYIKALQNTGANVTCTNPPQQVYIIRLLGGY